jgi:hypothetical protein
MFDLLETERRYVALVTVLIRQFLKPLLLLTYTEQEQFLTEEEVRRTTNHMGHTAAHHGPPFAARNGARAHLTSPLSLSLS